MSVFLEIILPILAFAVIATIAYALIRHIAPLLSAAKSDSVDAVLYVAIGMTTATQAIFSGEDAFKYCNPYVLFYLKAGVAIIGAGAASLKMFRSGRTTKQQ